MEESFSKILTIISGINKTNLIIRSARSSHGTARSYSVATFGIRKTLQIMKGVTARTYYTNYSTNESEKLVH